MSSITKSARGQPGTIRKPHVCNHNPQTTVFAHINGVRYGHGTGKKVSDILGAYSCSNCHDLIDGRASNEYQYSKAELMLMHFQGMAETQLKLIEQGLIVEK